MSALPSYRNQSIDLHSKCVFVFVPFLGNIKTFLSTNIQIHSLLPSSHVVVCILFEEFRALRNNVSDCFIVGFTHPAFGIISSTIYLCFDVVLMLFCTIYLRFDVVIKLLSLLLLLLKL